MDFQQFFTTAGMGAMGLVVAALMWTVREVIRLAAVVSQLMVAVKALEQDSEDCQAARRAGAEAMSKLETSVALLKQGQDHHGTLLHEIRDRLFHQPPVLAAAPARARRKAAP